MLTAVLRPFVGVVRDALRVLLHHWPQLVGLFLLGWIGRMGMLWLAVAAMKVSPTLAVLIMPLAPMATLLSLVLMVRVTAETLPAFAGLFAGTTPAQRWRGNLAVAAQVLLPFLALYISQGLLKEDVRLFLVESNTDMYLTQGEWTKAAAYAEGPFLIGLILLAIVARKIIASLDLGKKSVAWSFAATFLEVLWAVTLANALTDQLDAITAWVSSRAVIAHGLDLWHAALAALPTIPVLGALYSGLTTFLAHAGDLVLVPVAWLALGATVYGAELSTRPEFARLQPLPDHEAVTKRLRRIPSPVRRYAAQAVEPITTPVQNTVTAIGKIAAAGVVPMVLFCLIFVISSQVQVLVAEAFRAATAGADPWWRWALAPYSWLLERLAYFVLALSLLGAAVNAVVLGQRTATPADAGAMPPARTGTPAQP